MDNNETRNFASLLSERKIIIPMIQRDYAQGRDGERIESIRKSLIKKILKHLKNKTPIVLNFIFGIVNEKQNAFMPIDGQQRLTSLYLICWYLAVAEGRQARELFCNKTKGFDYQVRESSSKFFGVLGELTDDKKAADFEEYVKKGSNIKLSEFGWFKNEWLFDPTVDSALRFLDDLKTIYEDEYRDKYSGSLTEAMLDEENCPIQFVYSCQNDRKCDEPEKDNKNGFVEGAFSAENRAALTYINMNARGKLLSDFENLKALIHQRTEDPDKSDYCGNRFVKNYDTDYINIFLSMAEESLSDGKKPTSDRKKLTLDSKIKRMDDLTCGLLLNVYNDLRAFKDNSAAVDFLGLMNAMRDGGSIPENYFKFISYIIRRYEKSDNDKEKEIIADYCQNQNNDGSKRYKLFRAVWYDFRIGVLNAADQKNCENCTSFSAPYDKDGWERLCMHLGLKSAFDSSLRREDFGDWESGLFCLNGLVNHVEAESANGTGVKDIGDYLCRIDPTKAAAGIFGNRKKLFSDVTLMEEKVKAKIIGKGSDEEYKLLDEVGDDERFKHKIRYLLYISGFWKADGDIVWSNDDAFAEAWSDFKAYAELDKTCNPHTPDNDWKKAFYIVSLPKAGTLPEDNKEITAWDAKYLLWDSASDVTKLPSDEERQLDKVKVLYDILRKYKCACSVFVERIRKPLQPSSWLYYVLHRDYDDLLENNVTQENGTYLRNRENFFMYVLKKDIEKKDYDHLPCASLYFYYPLKNNESQRVESPDGHSNARNISFELKYTICFDKGEYDFSMKGGVVCRYKYCTIQNNTDVFDLYTDKVTIKEHEKIAEELKAEMNKIFTDPADPFVADEKHLHVYQDMAFKENFSELKDRIEKVLDNSKLKNNIDLDGVRMAEGKRKITINFIRKNNTAVPLEYSDTHTNPVDHAYVLNHI